MSQKKFKAFVSCSFDEIDKDVVNYFCNLISSFDFQIDVSNEGHPSPVQEKVKSSISISDCLIAICTKKNKIENSEFFKTSDWILNEIGMAFALNKPIVAFVEEGVKMEGFLPQVTSYKTFHRDTLKNNVTDIIQLLNNLENNLTNISEIGLSISCIKNSIVQKIEIFEDGCTKRTSELELRSLINSYSTYNTQLALISDSDGLSLKAIDFEFYSLTEEREIVEEIQKNEKNHVVLLANFSPPLNKDETVKFGYSHKTGKSHYTNLSDIELAVSKGKYSLSKPYAFEWALINSPTNFIKREIIFPRGFQITDVKFDVFVGRSENRDDEEYARVLEKKFFRKDYFGHQWKLSMEVTKPKMGVGYLMLWKPPRN